MGLIGRSECDMGVVVMTCADEYRAYKTGKCSDFTVVAGERSFPVHRVL